MSALDVAVAALLASGAAAQLVCVTGLVVVRGPYDKLHYAGAGATLGPLFIGAAAFLPQGLTAGGLLVVAVTLLVVLLAPATTMAFARAARREELGRPAPLPEEIAEEDR